jgi:GGDEF domain-containing protein
LQGISMDGWQVEAAKAGQRAAQVIRNVDLSASLAPFEFALCLVHCDRDGAERVVERLVQELRDYDCSMGIAVYPDDDCEADALIELARVRSHKIEPASAGPSF